MSSNWPVRTFAPPFRSTETTASGRAGIYAVERSSGDFAFATSVCGTCTQRRYYNAFAGTRIRQCRVTKSRYVFTTPHASVCVCAQRRLVTVDVAYVSAVRRRRRRRHTRKHAVYAILSRFICPTATGLGKRKLIRGFRRAKPFPGRVYKCLSRDLSFSDTAAAFVPRLVHAPLSA